MKPWKKYVSHVWGINLKKYTSEWNDELFVNLEFGKKVLHTRTANYSFQNLHKVMRAALLKVKADLTKDSVILNLGMGAGSTVEIIREELNSTAHITSVEHDPVIVEIAKSEFDIMRFVHHRIVLQDANDFLLTVHKESFDLIVCDLFKDKEVPEKFKTSTFFSQMFEVLKPNGNLIFNFIEEKNKPTFFQPHIDAMGAAYAFEIIEPLKGNYVLVGKKLLVRY